MCFVFKALCVNTRWLFHEEKFISRRYSYTSIRSSRIFIRCYWVVNKPHCLFNAPKSWLDFNFVVIDIWILPIPKGNYSSINFHRGFHCYWSLFSSFKERTTYISKKVNNVLWSKYEFFDPLRYLKLTLILLTPISIYILSYLQLISIYIFINFDSKYHF